MALFRINAMPSQSKFTWKVDVKRVSSLMKPMKGGIPIRANKDIEKTIAVRGILRPTPTMSGNSLAPNL
jgi:hypothetical protein